MKKKTSDNGSYIRIVEGDGIVAQNYKLHEENLAPHAHKFVFAQVKPLSWSKQIPRGRFLRHRFLVLTVRLPTTD